MTRHAREYTVLAVLAVMVVCLNNLLCSHLGRDPVCAGDFVQLYAIHPNTNRSVGFRLLRTDTIATMKETALRVLHAKHIATLEKEASAQPKGLDGGPRTKPGRKPKPTHIIDPTGLVKSFSNEWINFYFHGRILDESLDVLTVEECRLTNGSTLHLLWRWNSNTA
jgi:hypothetical protein